MGIASMQRDVISITAGLKVVVRWHADLAKGKEKAEAEERAKGSLEEKEKGEGVAGLQIKQQ